MCSWAASNLFHLNSYNEISENAFSGITRILCIISTCFSDTLSHLFYNLLIVSVCNIIIRSYFKAARRPLHLMLILTGEQIELPNDNGNDSLLTLNILGKKISFDLGDSLHEISEPIFWEKIRKMSSICGLLNQARENTT